MKNSIKNTFLYNIADSLVTKTFESSVNIIRTSKDDSKFNHINSKLSYLLYIHVPFCDNLCPFCTFHKYQHNIKESNNYFKNLREEIKILKSHNVKINSVYIGGGSPLINADELIKTIKLVKELFCVEDISCETDPNHIELNTIEKLKGLVKRLSIGIQSFDDTLLKSMGRYDKFGNSENIINRIKKIVGVVPQTSIDLIFNLPNQSEESLRNDINISKSLGVDQIVTYPLMNSKLNSKFLEQFIPNTNRENFYNIICEMLKDYNQNNMWSFSKDEYNLDDEYISKHNEYIGLGSGAFSYLQGNLFVNAFNLKEYEELLKSKKDTIIAKSTFSQKEQALYYLLSTLFSGSLSLENYKKMFGKELEVQLNKELALMKYFNLIHMEDETIFLTKKGSYVFIIMMSSFYSQMDRVRAMFRQKRVL
ncbi:coproporphyrinogen III oxidase family protein [Halarcobacter ebronensis]|uniref:Coproporphyrinogen III oxidase n=1 Tax=Halarcobacter ebronensis TaxID=1462615 RepID=A0A4V1M0C7_9BACT|nr:coproporphyrinogen III oxidase family protein [Halarcobacter ebronensis]QKF81677.1 oxygen-independent coproporphyrinogen III oxidase [Halarcobacter ebronensis]RXK04642.1 coproporphyrinogen III oxidase [Halarcobacter ebronensis]